MPRRLTWTVWLLGAVIVPPPQCRAQGFVEHLEPPVVERGKTTRVTAVGTGFGKALGLWTSLPPGAIKTTPVGDSTPTHAVFDVTVAVDAPVGICGVRLSTADGLGNAASTPHRRSAGAAGSTFRNRSLPKSPCRSRSGAGSVRRRWIASPLTSAPDSASASRRSAIGSARTSIRSSPFATQGPLCRRAR